MSSIFLSRFSHGKPPRMAMRSLAPAVLALGVLLANPASVFADGLSVTEWLLGSSARNPSASEYQDAIFDTVQSPFVGEHSVSLTSSPFTSASAQYLIEYLSNHGSFHIASQQRAVALASSSIQTIANGGIRITTTEPLFLNIDSVWNYSLPVGFMAGYFRVRVYSPGSPPTVLFHQAYSPQSIPGEPSSGTLSIQGDIILPPGPTWIMTYTMESSAYSGTQGYSATGEGYVNLQITPEPSTLALLALLLLAASRRRAVRRGAH